MVQWGTLSTAGSRGWWLGTMSKGPKARYWLPHTQMRLLKLGVGSLWRGYLACGSMFPYHTILFGVLQHFKWRATQTTGDLMDSWIHGFTGSWIDGKAAVKGYNHVYPCSQIQR